MDPWGHVAPWLFKDLVEGEDGTLGLLRCRGINSDVAQLTSGRLSPSRRRT